MTKNTVTIAFILAVIFATATCRPAKDIFDSFFDDDFDMVDTSLMKRTGPGSLSGSSISQEMVCVNGKCKAKMQKCAGKNCKTAVNNNVNINNIKSMGFGSHGFHVPYRRSNGFFGSGFIADLLKWDPFESMSGLYSNLFGKERQLRKENNAQAIKRLGQRI